MLVLGWLLSRLFFDEMCSVAAVRIAACRHMRSIDYEYSGVRDASNEGTVCLADSKAMKTSLIVLNVLALFIVDFFDVLTLVHFVIIHASSFILLIFSYQVEQLDSASVNSISSMPSFVYQLSLIHI